MKGSKEASRSVANTSASLSTRIPQCCEAIKREEAGIKGSKEASRNVSEDPAMQRSHKAGGTKDEWSEGSRSKRSEAIRQEDKGTAPEKNDNCLSFK